MRGMRPENLIGDPHLCPRCRLFLEICICNLIDLLELRTRVTLLIHEKEFRRITNTGRLIPLCLKNSAAVFAGSVIEKTSAAKLIPEGYETVILYPKAARTLDQDFIDHSTRPVNLLVPDGTWSQTAKILRSMSALQTLPRLKLPALETKTGYLRLPKESNHFSTFEALAFAMGLIEGTEVENRLMTVLTAMMDRLRKRKGRL